MIVLERIDPAESRADFRLLGSHDAAAREVFSRALALAHQLGLQDVRLQDDRACGRSGCSGSNPGGTTRTDQGTHEQLPWHRWEWVDGVPQCEMVFAHEPASRDLMALWVPLALLCSGAAEDRLMQLHTGLYEICANILEHGRPRHPAAVFSVVLRFHADRIEGHVQDSCERFDSARPPLQGVLERVATRARRGFGIHMMLRLIDHLQHEYNETGNRLVFTKGILP